MVVIVFDPTSKSTLEHQVGDIIRNKKLYEDKATVILLSCKSDDLLEDQISEDDILKFIAKENRGDLIMHQSQLTSPHQVITTAIVHQFYTIKKNNEYRALYKTEFEKTVEGMKAAYKELYDLHDNCRTGKNELI